MKKLFAMLVALCALAVVKPINAEPWEGFYVGGFGGANFISSNKKSHRSSSDTSSRRHKRDFRTGYMVGGFIGYRLCDGFRFEGEISYRHNESKKKHCRKGFHLSQTAYMANAYYDIDTSCWDCCWCSCGEIFPYIGAGIGFAHQRLSGRHRDDTDDSSRHHKNKKHGFAWQIILGLGYQFNACADASIEYRFFKGHINRIYNHGIGLAAKYHF